MEVDSAGVRTPGRRRRDRKAQLTGLAAELFRRHGYHAVGIGDIAAAAGVTGPAVYRHFTSKQDILAHVLLSGVDLLGGTVERILAEPGSPDARIRTLTAALARLAVERRDALALWRWLGRHLDPGPRSEVRRRGEALTAHWADELRRMRPELTPADADLLCRAAMGVLGSPANHTVTLGRVRHAELLADLADAVLHCPLPRPAGGGATASEGATTGAGTTDIADTAPAPSRREVLLSEATRLFRERGYHAVTMEDIGAAAGIAGPSIYRHFTGKAELLRAAGNRMLDRLLGDATRILTATPDPGQALDALIRSYAEVVLAHRDLTAVYIAEVATLPQAERAALQRLQRGYVAQWVRLVAAGCPDLRPSEVRVVTHAALTLATDLVRTGRTASRPDLGIEMAELMRTVVCRTAAIGDANRPVRPSHRTAAS